MIEDIETDELLSRLKKELNVQNDIELSRFLDIDPDIFSAWKRNGSVDYKDLTNQCLLNGIKLNKVFKEQKYDILEATVNFFIRRGHADTSVDYIAEKAGLPKETLHEFCDRQNEILI